MKLYQLLDIVNDDVLIKCVVNGTVVEGHRIDLTEFGEWLISDIRAEENVLAICIVID